MSSPLILIVDGLNVAVASKPPLKPKLRKPYSYSGHLVVVVKGSFIRVLDGSLV